RILIKQIGGQTPSQLQIDQATCDDPKDKATLNVCFQAGKIGPTRFLELSKKLPGSPPATSPPPITTPAQGGSLDLRATPAAIAQSQANARLLLSKTDPPTPEEISDFLKNFLFRGV